METDTRAGDRSVPGGESCCSYLPEISGRSVSSDRACGGHTRSSGCRDRHSWADGDNGIMPALQAGVPGSNPGRSTRGCERLSHPPRLCSSPDRAPACGAGGTRFDSWERHCAIHGATGCGSVGRAPPSGGGGRRFESSHSDIGCMALMASMASIAMRQRAGVKGTGIPRRLKPGGLRVRLPPPVRDTTPPRTAAAPPSSGGWPGSAPGGGFERPWSNR